MVKVVPVIVGPTASGKTDQSIKIAQLLNAEIVSADSRQIYKYLDIGTAKPTSDQREKAKIHLVDFLMPDAAYSAGDFGDDGQKTIKDIFGRRKIPLVVGGSGLYIRALFYPMFKSPKPTRQERERLNALERERGLDYLYKCLKNIDPIWAKKVGPRDTQRIKRGIEVYELTGEKISELTRQRIPVPYVPCYVGISIKREELYARIDTRFLRMIDEGLVEEVKWLLGCGFSKNLNALNTFGYKEIIQHLEGKLKLDDAIRLAQKNTRNYAKRQLTWFRGIKGISWLPPDERQILKVLQTAI